MNLGLPGAMASATPVEASSGDVSRRRVEVTTQSMEARVQELENQLLVLTRLGLSSAQRVRIHTAVTLWTGKLATDSNVIKTAMAGSKAFDAAQKNLKARGTSQDEIREQLGMPSIWVFNQLLRSLISNEQFKAAEPDVHTALVTAAATWDWKKVHAHIPHCKVGRMYNQSEKKLEVAAPMAEAYNHFQPVAEGGLTPTNAWILIEKYLIRPEPSFRLLPGTAPAGDLERRLQQWIDAHATSS